MSTALVLRSRAHLVREARSRAAVLSALGFLVAGIALGAAWVTRHWHLEPRDGQAVAVLCAYAAALLVLGGEVGASERSRGTLASLERAPGGLASAFRAKLALYALGVALAVVLAAQLFALSFWGPDPALATLPLRLVTEPGFLFALVVPGAGLALWVLAAGTWCPTGVLALPAGALVTAALLLAFAELPLLLGHSGPNAPDSLLFTLSYALAGLVAARRSFVRGLAGGGSCARAAWVGGGSGLLVLLPAFAVAALRPDELATGKGSLCLSMRQTVLSADGDHVYSRTYLAPLHQTWPFSHAAWWPEAWSLLPRREDEGVDALVEIDLRDGSWTSVPLEGADPDGLVRDFTAAWTALEGQPDLRELGIPADARALATCGLGRFVACARKGERWIYDPLRHVVRACDALVGADNPSIHVLVRRGDWLVWRREESGERHWMLYGPETASWREAAGLSELDNATFVLPDDRVVAEIGGEAFVLDPETGERSPLRLPDGTRPGLVVSAANPNAARRPADVVFASTERASFLATLDSEHALVVPLLGPLDHPCQLVGQLPDGRLVVLDDLRSLLAVAPEDGAVETLFPR